MVLDFAVKNYKAKCKIKDQMENILIRRGYMALAVMIENASQYRVNIDCGVSFNLLIAICNRQLTLPLEETLCRGTNDLIHQSEGVYLTGFFRIVYLHKYLKSYGFLFDLLTNSFIKRTLLRKIIPIKFLTSSLSLLVQRWWPGHAKDNKSLNG